MLQIGSCGDEQLKTAFVALPTCKHGSCHAMLHDRAAKHQSIHTHHDAKETYRIGIYFWSQRWRQKIRGKDIYRETEQTAPTAVVQNIGMPNNPLKAISVTALPCQLSPLIHSHTLSHTHTHRYKLITARTLR